MPAVQPLPVDKLHATLDPQKVPWQNSDAIPAAKMCKNGRHAFQPRAMQALELAINIKSSGFHVYLSGEPGLGRTYNLLAWLEPHAAQINVPPDLVFVQNFSNPDSPRLMALPAGQGAKFRDQIRELLEDIAQDLERRLGTMQFIRQRAKLMEDFQNMRAGLLHKMNSVACGKGFNLELDENGGIAIFPVIRGKRLCEDEVEKLDTPLRLEIRRKGDILAKSLVGLVRQMNRAEEAFHDDERGLEHEAMTKTLNALFSPLEQRLQKSCPIPEIPVYLSELKKDILKNTDAFLHGESTEKGEEHVLPTINPDSFLNRYEVNLFVDNSGRTGAPVIVEDNPSATNLLGCIERESEMGALVTDFTLIRNGSLHRANGGFLIIHADDILQHPLAWEGLLRALRSNYARIEDMQDMGDAPVRVKGIHPEPLELNVKVVLIGNEDIYETLLMHEERFAGIFNLKAHMTDMVERTPANIRFYLGFIAQIIKDARLIPFDATALAWLIDLGSHLCEDQKRLSLKFPQLRELMIEANALALTRNLEIVNAEILEEAYSAKTYRANLVEDEFMEDYDRQTIRVRTSGCAVGQVNGLSVTWQGDYEFGLPHCITCTVGVGHEGIIDLEREAELGGPIHTKAMMILKSFLTDLFARKKPLVLSASLYFEQSYAGIEGDSASGAELAALISALANVPVRLDLAFTGAVGNSGQIMAVGGVTRKIEGFYKVCARHGLTGTQGVIIPADNIDHLMLAPEILSSVANGKFYIYPVRNIEEALLLLTGMNTGRMHKNGGFTKGSLYDLADRRLEQLGCAAQNAFRRQRKD